MLGRQLCTKGDTAILALAGGVPGWLVAIFVVLLGLAFGSFLNVCISRLPRHESIVRPRSRCPKCGAAIGARDNLPVLSWILLRGRCRACGWRIPWRYPAVELATAALFLLCFLRFSITIESIGMAVLCFLLLGLAVMDAETLRLPDAFTWTGIGLGVIFAALDSGIGSDRPEENRFPIGLVVFGIRGARALPLPEAMRLILPAVLASVLCAVTAAVVILAIRAAYLLVRRREGMGLGDAKLLAMIAAWLGPAFTLLALFLAVVGAAVAGAAWIAVRGRRRAMAMRLPFGAFLSAAAIYAIFAGEPILEWYLRFFR